MDELLTSWLGSDVIYENIMRIIEKQKESNNCTNAADDDKQQQQQSSSSSSPSNNSESNDGRPPLSPPSASSPKKPKLEIPTFYRKPSVSSSQDANNVDNPQNPPLVEPPRRRLQSSFVDDQTWDGIYMSHPEGGGDPTADIHERDSTTTDGGSNKGSSSICIGIQADLLFRELSVTSGNNDISSTLSQYLHHPSEGYHRTQVDCNYIMPDRFQRLTKELCSLPTFFHKPLYARILQLWNAHLNNRHSLPPAQVVTYGIFKYYWTNFMEPYDLNERFFHLIKQPSAGYICRDDFFPYIKELLADHPGLEFLSSHAEFQDKYAVTVITRIFYAVNLCHSGKITIRQLRKSDLVEMFQQVDEEEDINKVTKYFSYEHFYVLYCRFWELDHDRDYKITREDLLKYGEHSLSHIIVDRVFDAAPRPFEGSETGASEESASQAAPSSREYLTYEDFIFFMLSEEDKANEFSVRYWFTCVDVDGDDKLNNMEMRSFYAVQLHRMQCMGHEVVPFEDMLCQMIDMIKPSNSEHLVIEDFLQPHCSQVSGSLFDALFNVNKYVMFEQRDPFLERQKREDEFETDWDRFACIDYNRLAMEEEQREEEAMEVDWVTMDEDEEDGEEYNSMGLSGGSSEAPF